jgi:hypothetical protein
VHRIAADTQKTFAMAQDAAASAQRIARSAEHAFNMLQKAAEAARVMGREADRVVEMLAATGIAIQGLLPMRHDLAAAGAEVGSEEPADAVERAAAATKRLDAVLMSDFAVGWVADQRCVLVSCRNFINTLRKGSGVLSAVDL